MYLPKQFDHRDPELTCALLREHPLATLITLDEHGHPCLSHLPIKLDQTGPDGMPKLLLGHLARANPLADIQDGALVKLSVMGAHAYISPDWYETPEMVPTWNYLAVEGSGYVRHLSDAALRKLLNDLTVQEERLLTPKPPWTLARLSEARLNQLLPSIAGFELVFDSLEGKAKLSQNRAQADIAGAVAGLEKRSDAASLAVATAMRKISLQ